MKLLYWLDEWSALNKQEQQARLPITGEDLLDDVFVKYEFVDLNKPLLFTFSPAGTNLHQQIDIAQFRHQTKTLRLKEESIASIKPMQTLPIA